MDRNFTAIYFLMCVSALFLAALAFVSCEKIIELPTVSGGGRLYVECFPSDGTDTTFVYVSGTRPVGKNTVVRDLTGVSVAMSVNGRPSDIELRTVYRHQAVFYMVCPLRTGDEVALTVSAEGYPTVSSKSTVPEGPSFELDRELYGGNIRHYLSFTVPGDGLKSYYGVKMRGTLTYSHVSWSNGAPEYSVTETPMDLSFEAHNLSEMFTDNITGAKPIAVHFVNGGLMTVFEDDGGKSGRLDISLDVPYIRDRYDYTTLTDTLVRRCHYNLEVFSVSQEAYKFLNPKINYSLLAAGLVPPFMSTGNIDGGYGMLSCMGRSDTGWLANMEPIP